MAKIDIKSAYRNVPIHPDDRWLLGMMWKGSVFVDAPKIFTAIADGVARTRGVNNLLHYLDDFFLTGAPSSDECRVAKRTLLQVFEDLGIPVAKEKPTTCLIFLGLEIDSITMQLRLPAEKLAALLVLIQSWLHRQSCTRRELESLVGSLHFACSVVRSGKTFLRRVFELLSVARKRHHYIRLNQSFRSDLRWWDLFLAPLNRRPLARPIIPASQRITFASDASGSIGCGTPHWLQLLWRETGSNQSIASRLKNFCPLCWLALFGDICGRISQ